MEKKIAVVTGATRGIGQAIAVTLAGRGHRVVVTHRGPAEAAARTVELVEAVGGEAAALSLDVTAVDTFADFADALRATTVERWGTDRIDVLVNNAGIGLFDRLEDLTPDRFDALVATNLRGPVFLLQAVLPLLRDGGRVLNISTSLTRHVSPGTSIYAASKAALEVASRSLASELGARGIRINTIAPGPTATDFNGGAMRDEPELRSILASQTALGRVGLPEEIADAAAALVSDDLRWLTAERIEVSGGALL